MRAMSGPVARPLHLVVVPHTHWDREWYRTHEQFRARLVTLVDELLDLLEAEPGFAHFLLDGQTIVLDDYLEVRPRARPRLEKLARAGRLAVGPWHVLPDEWLVSGEALIRNLRTGLERAQPFGGAMPLGYVPDQFGHVGQLPQIFAGFGLEAAVLWRGVGADVDRTLFAWEAPDGTRLPTVYLLHGYGNAVHLPTDPEVLAARLRSEADSLAAHSDVDVLLLMNGSDHERPEPRLPAALEAALARLPGISGEIGSLARFVSLARAEARGPLPVHRGELRSGLRCPLLPGCASARMPQKRAEFENDRLLTRWLEPLAAWLGALGGDADPERIGFAWRVALENHPHDSVCGCSIDAVHEQMDTRYRRVAEIAGERLECVTEALARRIALASPAVPAGYGAGARDAIAVWNPNTGGATAVEAELELDVALAKGGAPRPFHLRRADGSRIPVSAELLRPAGRPARGVFARDGVLVLLPGVRREFNGLYANAISWRRTADRIEVRVRLGATPEAGFDVERERRALQAALGDEAVREVAVEAFEAPRLRVRFVDVLPGHGLRVYRLAPGPARTPEPLVAEALSEGGAAIENASWRVEADAAGRVTLWSRRHGLRIDDALRIVSEGDRGDEYNFDPVPDGEVVAAPESARVRARRVSGGEVALRLDLVYRVPEALERSRAERCARRVALPVRVDLRLLAGLDRLDVEAELDNRARDHRLRLHLRAPFAAARFEVESAFEVAERPIAPAPDGFGSARPSERPIGAGPQRRFATLHGAGGLALTVANRGLPEVEALPGTGADAAGEIAVTLLRAIGWLSRGDLRLRPGPAGPILRTPGAQVPGRHRAELSLRLHAADDPRRAAEAHAFAAPPLAFHVGAGGPGPLRDGDRLVVVDDPRIEVSAIEPREEGAFELRLVNLSAERRTVRVHLAGAPHHALGSVDLAGRAVPMQQGFEGERNVELGPWRIETLRAARIPPA
jgi:hypothetical protein